MIIKKINKNEVLIKNVCIIYFLYALLDTINIFFNIKGISKINYLMCVGILLYIFFFMVRHNKVKWIYISLVLILVWLSTMFFFPDNIIYFSYRLMRFGLYCYPVILCIIEIDDISLLYKSMYRCINIMFLYSIILFLVEYILSKGDTYNGTISHILAVCCVFYINKLIEEKKLIYIISFIIGGFMIFTVGQRNSLLVIGVYVLMKVFSYLYVNRKIRYIIIFTLLFGFLGLFYHELIETLIYFTDKLGLNSRTLNLLLKGDILSHNSGRDLIYKTILNELSLRPIVGLGVCGDSLAAAKHDINLYYSHSILIEIYSSFGYIVGSGILIYLLYTIIRILISKNNCLNNLLLIFSAISIGSLLFNGSFWISIEFWIYISLYYKSKGVKSNVKQHKKIN